MKNDLERLAKLIRYFSLIAPTAAGSGHPTSSLSAADLMATLMFGGYFHYDLKDPAYLNNDRLIFSKGHASPLFYALWAAAGAITEEELLTLRKFGSRLEGHPSMVFPFTEAPTGSLGQGLSIGVGMALAGKYLDKRPYRSFVLLGDSEMAEGSVWEALQIAAHYKLDNLVAILDVNRLGQRGETMYGHDTGAYVKRAAAFGWQVVEIDGHNFEAIGAAYAKALEAKDQPVMVIAKTRKGKGVSFLEDRDGWHGKALSTEELTKALAELGGMDKTLRGQIAMPEKIQKPSAAADKSQKPNLECKITNYPADKPVATRRAYGNALNNLYEAFSNIVVLDGETSNSTFAEIFKKAHPEKFFEMYVAEQNMIGAALGLSRRGKIPFVSTFAAFFSRAFDQIRMSQYADANIKFVGSHAGVSIGEDGASQMGLEDLAMFRTLLNSAVLYPADAVSTEKLVMESAKHFGNVYIRTTRKDTPILYRPQEEFPIGGSKTLKSSADDVVTVVAAGITLHEALAAYEELQKAKIKIRIIDLYSIKPLDVETLKKAVKETKAVITVEDHFVAGGIGEAVRSALADVPARIESLAVGKMPKSGKPEELLAYEEIDKNAIIKAVKDFLKY